MQPDPKDGARVVDPQAVRHARFNGDVCAACERPPSNVHHVIQRGSPFFGDDVPGNLVLICGTGTTECHGAWHGTPYVYRGERRDAEWVGKRMGVYFVTVRPDVIEYVLAKLGAEPGAEYLRRHYYLEVCHHGRG